MTDLTDALDRLADSKMSHEEAVDAILETLIAATVALKRLRSRNQLAWMERVEGLIGALRKYGKHIGSCDADYHQQADSLLCSCGLREAVVGK